MVLKVKKGKSGYNITGSVGQKLSADFETRAMAQGALKRIRKIAKGLKT